MQRRKRFFFDMQIIRIFAHLVCQLAQMNYTRRETVVANCYFEDIFTDAIDSDDFFSTW